MLMLKLLVDHFYGTVKVVVVMVVVVLLLPKSRRCR
jgi:hypothetical protein